MVSLRSTALAVTAAFITCANADYYIQPSSVPLSTRQSWCDSEIQTCPFICEQTPPGTTVTNTCDPDTLTYGCLCGDNKAPNVSEYSLTLPFFVCQEWGNQCVTACGNDNTCQSACRQDHPCGATNPKRLNTSTATAKATPSATNSASTLYTDTPGGSSDSKSPTGRAAAVDVGAKYGMAIVMTCVFGGYFAL